MTTLEVENDFVLTDEEGVPVKSYSAALDLVERLKTDSISIQTQLGDQSRTDVNGTRLTAYEFYEWRQKAKVALKHKLQHLREAKRWAHLHRLDDVKAKGTFTDALEDLRLEIVELNKLLRQILAALEIKA